MSGKKTYICAALGAVVFVLFELGWIDGQTAEALWALLGFGGLAALRDGMARLGR